MISRQFIDRPLFACVVSIFIVIAGLAALRGLTIALYPNILPPTVEVATSYPGASADVVAETESQHLGLRSLRERAELAGGRLTLETTVGTGTLVRVAVPLMD